MSHVRRLPQYALGFLVVASWFAHADPEVNVERRHGVFQVRAEAPAAVDAGIAWQVLTDYNRLRHHAAGRDDATLRNNHNRPAK